MFFFPIPVTHPSLALLSTFTQALKYATTFSRFTSREMIQHIRKTFASSAFKLEEFEIAQLVNLCLETSEEAKTLIPR